MIYFENKTIKPKVNRIELTSFYLQERDGNRHSEVPVRFAVRTGSWPCRVVHKPCNPKPFRLSFLFLHFFSATIFSLKNLPLISSPSVAQWRKSAKGRNFLSPAMRKRSFLSGLKSKPLRPNCPALNPSRSTSFTMVLLLLPVFLTTVTFSPALSRTLSPATRP